jgi:hypothetical protein
MRKNVPLVTIAVALLNSALALLYAKAAYTHPTDLWLVPISSAFTGTALLGAAVGLRLRELGTRLSALERELSARPAA